MTKEIKFRGKANLSSNWIYGYFVKHKNKGFIINDHIHFIDLLSVGQYTGLKDYNGNDIYENDILLVDREGRSEYYYITYYEGCFCLFTIKGTKYIIKSIHDIFNKYSHIIVGNIYDNKLDFLHNELLKLF